MHSQAMNIGVRVGKLTIIKLHCKHRTGTSWVCKCDCGNTVIKTSQHLKFHKSCGCIYRDHKFGKHRNYAKQKLQMYKKRLRQRPKEWSISDTDAVLLFNQPCIYCNEPPGDNLSGIDRIDNALGYVNGNCAPCCSTCNYMKGTLSKQEFMDTIKRIITNHPDW